MDVNGLSFVKKRPQYFMDFAQILSRIVRRGSLTWVPGELEIPSRTLVQQPLSQPKSRSPANSTETVLMIMGTTLTFFLHREYCKLTSLSLL